MPKGIAKAGLQGAGGSTISSTPSSTLAGNMAPDGGIPLQGGFAARLYQLRLAKGWSQSELSRRAWGTEVDGRGYTVARKRDRVSAYESGRASPERTNLEELAKALEVSVEVLAPDLVAAGALGGVGGGAAIMAGRRPGTVKINIAPAENGVPMVHLTVDAVVPLALAAQIMGMVSEFAAAAVGASRPDVSS